MHFRFTANIYVYTRFLFVIRFFRPTRYCKSWIETHAKDSFKKNEEKGERMRKLWHDLLYRPDDSVDGKRLLAQSYLHSDFRRMWKTGNNEEHRLRKLMLVPKWAFTLRNLERIRLGFDRNFTGISYKLHVLPIFSIRNSL
jgi:hypothetical protein